MTTQAPPGLARIGAAALVLEALVVLLAMPAVVSLHRGVPPGAIAYLLAVVVALLVAASMQSRRGGRTAGSLAQLLVIGAGVVTWPLYVLGGIFAAIWVGYLRMGRRSAPR